MTSLGDASVLKSSSSLLSSSAAAAFVVKAETTTQTLSYVLSCVFCVHFAHPAGVTSNQDY